MQHIFKQIKIYLLASLCLLQVTVPMLNAAASADGYVTRLQRGLKCYIKGTPCTLEDKKTLWKTVVGILVVIGGSIVTVKGIIPGWKEFRAIEQWNEDITIPREKRNHKNILNGQNVINVRNALDRGLPVNKELSLAIVLANLSRIEQQFIAKMQELQQYKDNISQIPDKLGKEVGGLQIYKLNQTKLAQEIIKHKVDLDKKVTLKKGTELSELSIRERLPNYNFSPELLHELGLSILMQTP